MCQSNHDLIVPIRINNSIDDNKIDYIASFPHDRKMSFSGSGLPFIDFSQAFENTPNMGSVVASKGDDVHINLMHPNSFYVHSHLINPTLFIRYKNNNVFTYKIVVIGDHVPFRSLYHPKERDAGPTFYKDFKDSPVLSQEQILYNSAYPKNNITPSDFWGLKPSH
jgi:hypothetical protein